MSKQITKASMLKLEKELSFMSKGAKASDVAKAIITAINNMQVADDNGLTKMGIKSVLHKLTK